MALKQKYNIKIKEQILIDQIAHANNQKRAIYLLFIATKPCYIKLASVVHALEKSNVPHLIVDVGQHYDNQLISAQFELDYSHSISVYLNAKGDVVERNEILHGILKQFHEQLRVQFNLSEQAIPLVSGDTSSAGIVPLIWYLLTGIKSIHIEAGLRSFAPKFKWSSDPVKDIKKQLNCQWEIRPDQPFPEGLDTRLASICSQLFFAPIEINKNSLLNEGYTSRAIKLSGSLSADAIELIQKRKLTNPIYKTFPLLKDKKWVRVDVHRRENLTEDRLSILFRGLKIFQEMKGNVLLVMSNGLTAAIDRYNLKSAIEDLNSDQLLITKHWDDYGQVIDFITSPNCLGIYTDSGGLQEESNVLGIKCATFRFSTDRPESIFQGRTNVLLPPISPEYIANGLKAVFFESKIKIALQNQKSIYGKNVGIKIVQRLEKHQPAPAVIDKIISY